MPLSDTERQRYARHLALAEFGSAGQEKLKAARVLVIGAGGLGSPAALYLAAGGVGTLGLLDFDRLDASNLQRQVLYDTASVGEPKAELARARLAALNPELSIVAHDLELCAANVAALFRDYELIIDGSDRIGTRYLVNDACVLYGKPLVSAAIHRFEGQAMTYVPGRGPCYRCLFPQMAEGLVPNCAEAGVLGVLPGVLGTIQATEAIKVITGIGKPLIGRLLTYDALELEFHEFRFQRRADCAVCGEHPSIVAPSDPPGFCTLAELARVPSIGAVALARQLQAHPPGVRVIDVREPSEFALGHLPDSVNLPLSQLESGAPAVPGVEGIVFVCKSGVRSRRACAIARRAGVLSASQLEGGLLAWREAVDPLLPL